MPSLPRFPGLVELGPTWGRAVLALAQRLGLSADELAATIYLESGGRPTARSPGGRRGGLLQWSDSTARLSGAPSLGALMAEDAFGQLRYVEGYFRPLARRCTRPGDVRLAVFASAGLGLADAAALPLAPDLILANRGLDANGDGVITAGEVRGQCLAALRGRARWELGDAPTASDGDGLVVLGLGAVALLAWGLS